jgi:hypothetical protein
MKLIIVLSGLIAFMMILIKMANSTAYIVSISFSEIIGPAKSMAKARNI